MQPIHFARPGRSDKNWGLLRRPCDDGCDHDRDPDTIGSVADHHLRLPHRRDHLRAAFGDGLLPAADARRKGLGPHHLRPGHGDAEPVLGPRPAVLRRDRRPLRHLARAGARRPHLRRRPLSDGDRRQRRPCCTSAAACWSASASPPARSRSCLPPSPGTRRPRSAPSSSASARRRVRPACSCSRRSARA